jgi:hypothetical protein
MQHYRPQIIFLFDEIEPILLSDWGCSFLANWRSLLQNTPNLSPYISAAFAGASEMYEIARDIGSPLANILEWRELELFSLDDTAKLMCKPSQYNWPDDFVLNVYNATGGHPFLIQYIMRIVCSQDVEKALQALEDAKQRFLNEQKIQFQNWWDRFDSTTRTIYVRLAEQDQLSRKEILSGFGDKTDRSLAILAHTGVIYDDLKVGLVRTAGTLFRDWFTQFGNIESAPISSNQHLNISKLVDRMDSALSRDDYAEVLHTSASIFETLAKDVVSAPSVQNQTLKKFFDKYRKNSALPKEILDYILTIYESRNTTPLAGHGSTKTPNITKNQAIFLAEMTKAFVNIEYKLQK